MKKIIILALISISVFIFLSCKGETGDKGKTGATGPSGADGNTVIMFQQGVYPNSTYTGVKDTGIIDNNPTYNFGGCSSSGAGAYPAYISTRSLIKFDVSSIIPSNVIVTKAELVLNINQIYGTNTYTAYKMTHDWVEGTVCDATSVGTATWNNYGSGAWTNPGGDYDSTPVSNSLIVTGTPPQSITFTLNPAMVQAWISNPSTNYGILIKANNESTVNNSIAWNAKESPVDSPLLKIYYRLP